MLLKMPRPPGPGATGGLAQEFLGHEYIQIENRIYSQHGQTTR